MRPIQEYWHTQRPSSGPSTEACRPDGPKCPRRSSINPCRQCPRLQPQTRRGSARSQTPPQGPSASSYKATARSNGLPPPHVCHEPQPRIPCLGRQPRRDLRALHDPKGSLECPVNSRQRNHGCIGCLTLSRSGRRRPPAGISRFREDGRPGYACRRMGDAMWCPSSHLLGHIFHKPLALCCSALPGWVGRAVVAFGCPPTNPTTHRAKILLKTF